MSQAYPERLQKIARSALKLGIDLKGIYQFFSGPSETPAEVRLPASAEPCSGNEYRSRSDSRQPCQDGCNGNLLHDQYGRRDFRAATLPPRGVGDGRARENTLQPLFAP